MRKYLLLLCAVPALLSAQDYTIFGESDPVSTVSTGANTMMVIPFHPFYMMSEADRMLTPAGMDVQQMREKVRQRCTMEITKALSDSLDAIDLSIGAGDSEIDLVDYVYNALDYKYVALRIEEEERKRFKIRLPKKKEGKVYGAFSTRRDGQLDRVEVDHDRYMSATFGNPGAVDYLQDIHAFEYIFAITQVEVKRNLEDDSELPYFFALHFELMDSSGEQLYGGKNVEYLSAEQMEYEVMMRSVIPAVAAQVSSNIWSHLNQSSPEPSSQDFSDY